MKKKSFLAGLVLTAAFALSTVFCSAQDSIAYQLVIRNSAGELITNKQVNMKFSLMKGSESFYEETMPATTDKYGNISVMVGTGKATKGAMKDVPWSTMDISLKVETDVNGGENFAVLGTVPFAASPYAMYAATAGSNANNGSPKDGDALFEVCDRDGKPVFAVYNDGIVVYVDENENKAKRSGFVVTGRKVTKDGETADYFAVDAEGTHVFVDDAENSDKAPRSGFVVTGRKVAKSAATDNETLADNRTATKAAGADMFAVNGSLTTVYVDDTEGDDKAKRSGFVVTGRPVSKDSKANFLAISSKKTDINTETLTVAHPAPQGSPIAAAPAPILVVGNQKVEMKTDVAMEGSVVPMVEFEGEKSDFEVYLSLNNESFIPIDSVLKWGGIDIETIDFEQFKENGHFKYVYDNEYLIDATPGESIGYYDFLYFNKTGQRTKNDETCALSMYTFHDGTDSPIRLYFNTRCSTAVYMPVPFAISYTDNNDEQHNVMFTVDVNIDNVLYKYDIEKGYAKYKYNWNVVDAYYNGFNNIIRGWQIVEHTIDYYFTDYGRESIDGVYDSSTEGEIHGEQGKYQYVEHKSANYPKQDYGRNFGIDKSSDTWEWDGDEWYSPGEYNFWDYDMPYTLFSLAGVNTIVRQRALANNEWNYCMAGFKGSYRNDFRIHKDADRTDVLDIVGGPFDVDIYSYKISENTTYDYYVYKGIVLKIDSIGIADNNSQVSRTILECIEFVEGGEVEQSFHRWLKNSGVTNYNGIVNDAFLGENYDGIHYYVDLNLPSGNLWAANNVGAPSSYDWGDYLQWGRFTEPKNGTYADNSYDVPNNLTDSPRLTDAAWRWGRDNDSTNSDWCMPTRADWQELIDNCFWVWVKGEQGVRVYSTNQNKGQTYFIDDWETFYSKPEAEMMLSGDYIFLPAAGFYSGSSLTNYETTIDKMQGYYWAADKNSDGTNCIAFGMQYMQVRNNSCYQGLQVRAVAHKNTKFWVEKPDENSPQVEADGSEEKPFQTIEDAVNEIMSQYDPEEDERMTYTIMIKGEVDAAYINIYNEFKPKQITLCGANGFKNGEPQDVIMGGSQPPLRISETNTVIIKNLKLTGGGSDPASPIYQGGGLNIDNATVVLDSGAFVMQNVACTTSMGGGVSVYDGTLIMRDGSKICNNTVGNNGDYGRGAGVYVCCGSTFVMEGGEISGNKAVGTYYNNQTNETFYSQGGGVYVDSDSEFEMHGGLITGNNVDGEKGAGGGVYVNAGERRFTMLGGEITGNTANVAPGAYLKGNEDFDPLRIGGSAYINDINLVFTAIRTTDCISIVDDLKTNQKMSLTLDCSQEPGSTINLLSYYTNHRDAEMKVIKNAISKFTLTNTNCIIEEPFEKSVGDGFYYYSKLSITSGK